MNKAYFQNGKHHDGQVVGVQGTQRMELREVGNLILVTVLDAVKGNVVLSKEYIQDDLADASPTITLLGGFTTSDVAQLATEAELNAANMQGKWNLVGPVADTITTSITDVPSNSYIGYVNNGDIAALSSLNMLATATAAAMAHDRNRSVLNIPGGIANLGQNFMTWIGL